MKTIGTLALCFGAIALVACGDDSGRMRDAGPVIVLDGSADTGGGRDGGPDAGRDAGTVTGCGDLGEACMADRGCRRGECEARLGAVGSIGGASDPIVGHPDGDMATVMTDFLPGNYCTTVPYNIVSMGGCDPNAPPEESSCSECESCVNFGTDDMGNVYSMCMFSCEPSIDTNPCPQADHECSLGSKVCLGGCDNDHQCALYRADTNMNGEIDPYDPMENPTGDNWVYDTAGMWTCNETTRRCEHMAPATAEAGAPCTIDSECELYGRCIDELSFEWPGGYCLKFGCDVAGNECAGNGVCDTRNLGDPVCLEPCTVANPMEAGNIFSNNADCRTGYACNWDGESGAVADNGVCIPGNYNAITTPNIGADCRDDMGVADETECYSPYGGGSCLDLDRIFVGGDALGGEPICTFFDCGAPGYPTDICGTGAVCATFMGSTTTLCLQTCTAAEDCNTGLGCWDASMAGILTGGMRVCMSGCLADGDCRTGQTCNRPSMDSLGTCM